MRPVEHQRPGRGASASGQAVVLGLPDAAAIRAGDRAALAQAEGSVCNEPKPADIALSITFDGKVHWNGQPASDTELEVLMTEAASKTPLPELQLKVDRQVDYGRVASVLALASQQGLLKLAFVSQPESAP